MDDYNIVILILLVFFFFMIASNGATSTFPMSKPGCEDQVHCGNVSIPFPFGTREGCYRDERFVIQCLNSSKDVVDPPQPVLLGSTIIVADISLEGQMRIMYDVGYDCYDPKKNNTSSDYFRTWIQLAVPMVFNSTANKFTAVGCDTYALVEGESNDYQYLYTTGCISKCGNKDDVKDGPCSGIGCCQTSIPSGAWKFNVTLNSYDNHTYVSDFNPCSYGFLIEEAAFKFFADNVSNFDKAIGVPVVVDWVVAYEKCEEAKKNWSSYACKTENSVCYDQEGALGYRCKCKEGFEGNPYLGCQDIDECESESSTLVCANYSSCINTVGSYHCLCNQGYHGDGRKDGEGCIADPQPHKKNYWPIYAGAFSGLGFLLLIATIFTLYKIVKRKRDRMIKDKYFKQNGGLLLQQQLSTNEGIVEKTRIFTSSELDKASDGFNPNLILGQGGQGTVYKGMLTDGRLVAIKKSKRVDEIQLEQFINEVVILSQVNHRNVVKLLGCCLETEVPVLVYELIPNGTLFSLIHNKNDGDDDQFPFTWKLRLRIATEVAGALAYLHSATLMPIYHRDIKTSNILLDEKYMAKVSDFGTSRSIAIDKTHFTTNVKGTFGYLDPEYFQSSQFTEKSDVYSFGVVLVELLTRKMPISSSKTEKDSHLSLATRFLISMDNNRLHNILDPQVLDEGNKDKVVAMAKLAQKCLSLNGKNRPTMKEVAIELETIKLSATRTTVTENFHSQRLFNGEKNELVMFTDSNSLWTTETGSVEIELTDAYPLLRDTI